MRFAVLTDIHGNREAFEAVLADAKEQGFDQLVLLGDLVGYGPDPGWCVDQAAALRAAGAICLRGNHDHAASGGDERMNWLAMRSIEWTKAQLDVGQQEFLRSLPLLETVDDALFVHASADDPAGWNYVLTARDAMRSFNATDARVILCGHVHVPLLVSTDGRGRAVEEDISFGRPVTLAANRRWMAVVGSVGQPRDDVPQAGYALLDAEANTLTFRRVAYDTATTVAKIHAAGMPEQLAQRLVLGQ